MCEVGSRISTQLVAMLAIDGSLRSAILSEMNFTTGECVDVNGQWFIATLSQPATPEAGTK